MSFRIRRRRIRFACQAVVLVVAMIALTRYASSVVLGDNLHVVVPGKLYRSAQLSTGRLDDVIGEYDIACVLSLRQSNPPSEELVEEVEHLDRAGLPHDNVTLRVKTMPPPEALEHLIERFDHGPYPMLVHCQHGADRTGLAVTIWLALYGGKSVEEARNIALSWRTGHFEIGSARAIDAFFDLYQATANGQDLRTWMVETYPRLYGSTHT
jgi:protein tyrosine/serine phosphatase